ncbi:MAG: YitT family protein [Bacteroidales bacterium]|nr:YitT family protein [Bacteroidales bacterium]
MKTSKILSILWDYFLMTAGTFVYVMAWTSFLQPNHLASGGLTGLTTILDYATQGRLPMDLTFALINVFLLVAGFLFLGKSFGFKTIYVIGLSSLLFWLLPAYFPELEVVDPDLDKIMVVLIGGAMESIGIGLILLRGGSTGGTDIVAMILNKYWPISPGKVYLYSDVFIISSLLLIPVEQGGGVVNMIYAYMMMLVFSFGVDYVVLGEKSSVQLLVFSKKYKEIADHIIYDVQRGVTALQSVGWYSQQESKVLLIILRKQQMNEVINEIKRIDKDAFVSVSSANSVFGEGFEEIKSGPVRKKSKQIEG